MLCPILHVWDKFEYADPNHRMAAVVSDYATQPGRTVVIAPDRAERDELNPLGFRLQQRGKEQVQATFAQLDPIELIRRIRCVQEELAMASNNELEQLKSESAESFLRKLRTVWHQGEVRPTHRSQTARRWRTRPDLFETVRSRIQEQLSLTPDMGAKELLQQLRKRTLASSLRIKSGLCGAGLGSGERTWRSA